MEPSAGVGVALAVALAATAAVAATGVLILLLLLAAAVGAVQHRQVGAVVGDGAGVGEGQLAEHLLLGGGPAQLQEMWVTSCIGASAGAAAGAAAAWV